jgi:HlyD family secretion protein
VPERARAGGCRRRGAAERCLGAAARRLGAAAAALLFAAGCGEKPAPGWAGYVEGEYLHLAAAVGGKIATLAVRDGDMVAPGTLLFTLDAVPEQAARAEAQAQLRGALAQAADTTKGKRPDEIAVVRAQRAQAAAQAALARSELVRVQDLYAKQFVSAQRLDDARAALAQADALVASLDAQLAVARLPARSDAQLAAAAQAQAASSALRGLEWREQQARVAAPAEGVVADTYFRVGEVVAAGQPVLALLPAGRVKARFFVPEPELGALRLGEPVLVHCDGCGAPIAARVSFVATRAEYTPPVIYSNEQRARLVFMVEARADDAAGAAKLKPGQPVAVHRAAAAAQ